ncbi:MAG: hypothetical protein WA609_10190 [Terriglobales bacterium]
MMEALIELVAASFVRHGIECPAHDSPSDDSPTEGLARMPIEVMSQVDSAALPQHSYRKKAEASVAT